MLAMKPLDITSVNKTEPGPGATDSAFSLPGKPAAAPSAPDGAASALVGESPFEVKNTDGIEPLDPSASQRQDFCENRYNQIMIELAEIEDRMSSQGSDEREENFTDPDKRLDLLRRFDNLMDLIDGFFDLCREFMPAVAVDEIRRVRIHAERLRGGLLIEDGDPNPLATIAAKLGTTARSVADVFSEGLSALASGLLAIGAWLGGGLNPAPSH